MSQLGDSDVVRVIVELRMDAQGSPTGRACKDIDIRSIAFSGWLDLIRLLEAFAYERPTVEGPATD